MSEPRINDRIRVPEIRLVGPSGEQVGIVRVEDALRLAREADLDLVEVAPDAQPPVAKLMDYGKYKYESDMKAREARRNQANAALKEIRFRLKIDTHDYETKKGHVERFLTAGDKVKVMIMFRGREQSRPEAGLRLLSKLAEEVSELGFVESSPRVDGRNMIMVLGPTKKKASDAKGESRRRAQRTSAAERRPEPRPAAPTPPTPTPKAPTRSSADDAQPSPAQAAVRVTPPAAPAAPKPAAPRTDPPKPVAAPKPAAPKPAVPKPMPTPLGVRPKPTPRPKAD